MIFASGGIAAEVDAANEILLLFVKAQREINVLAASSTSVSGSG